MKNAHARFGRLEFTRQMRDTTTEVRLAMDRFIGEADEKDRAGGRTSRRFWAEIRTWARSGRVWLKTASSRCRDLVLSR